jgi:hypothetical protein
LAPAVLGSADAEGADLGERPVGTSPQLVEDVRATVADGHLIVGWDRYVRSIGRQVYYLRRFPLGG